MEVSTIHEKLLAIQSELRAPKDQFNGFGKYKYRNAEGILEAVKPLARKHNAVCVLNDSIQSVGNRYYIVATATLIDCENGQSISAVANAREEDTKKGMDGSQITGTASSYARKYALGGLFAIDDGRDSDALNDGRGRSEGAEEAPDALFGAPGADLTCERCGAIIEGTTGKGGEPVSAEQVLILSKKLFGGAHYCADCQKALRAQRSAAGTSGRA